MKRLEILILVVFMGLSQFVGAQDINRMDPPYWWTGMKNPKLQILVYGEKVSELTPQIEHHDVVLESVVRTENKNYLFLNLHIKDTKEYIQLPINFKKGKKIVSTINYHLKSREKEAEEFTGFGTEDVIYLAMPDRFSNGDSNNDSAKGMLEKADRENPDGRHGGDIQGVINHIDYIKDLGVTALWLNPVLENNHKDYSYHGYAISDFYNVDPRHGTNEDYKNLANKLHENGMKLIMDQILNHCGINNYLMQDLPSKNWIHHFKEETRSNFRASVIADPYAAEHDKEIFLKGWFDSHMPDLNQHDPLLAKYLIQNSIWWVEYAQLDGIRLDTQPYSYKDYVSEWAKAIYTEYPNFRILGESWLQRESFTAYYQANDNADYSSNIPTVTDFPYYFALSKGLNEPTSWTEGISRLYYVLAQDYLYADASVNVIFPDNHDLTRIFSSLGEDVNKLKMALSITATMRGIPMIYYGTEIGMTGEEHHGHGHIRKDFPGGWESDSRTAFTKEGRTDLENEIFDHLQLLLKWRKGSDAVINGKFKHFIPMDGMYAYCRYTEEQRVLVLVNSNEDKDLVLDQKRFYEVLDGAKTYKDVLDGEFLEDISKIAIPSGSVRILELNL